MESSSIDGVRVFLDIEHEGINIINAVAEVGSIPGNGEVTLDGDELLIEAEPEYDGSAFAISCYAGDDEGSMGSKTLEGIVEEPIQDHSIALPFAVRSGSTVNMSTMINGFVSVRMFDAAGRNVGELYSGQASGLNSIPLPKASSGLYFIRVESPNGSEIHKLILLD
jgi:hypothetical protein